MKKQSFNEYENDRFDLFIYNKLYIKYKRYDRPDSNGDNETTFFEHFLEIMRIIPKYYLYYILLNLLLPEDPNRF